MLCELHTVVINPYNADLFEAFCRKHLLKPIHVLILYNEKYVDNVHIVNLVADTNTDKLKFSGYRPIILYQTSKYIYSNDIDTAIKELLPVTNLLKENGYNFIREKIEAVRNTVRAMHKFHLHII